jgi:hypothetical protein
MVGRRALSQGQPQRRRRRVVRDSVFGISFRTAQQSPSWATAFANLFESRPGPRVRVAGKVAASSTPPDAGSIPRGSEAPHHGRELREIRPAERAPVRATRGAQARVPAGGAALAARAARERRTSHRARRVLRDRLAARLAGGIAADAQAVAHAGGRSCPWRAALLSELPTERSRAANRRSSGLPPAPTATNTNLVDHAQLPSQVLF